jgi:hypothetical protein
MKNDFRSGVDMREVCGERGYAEVLCYSGLTREQEATRRMDREGGTAR